MMTVMSLDRRMPAPLLVLLKWLLMLTIFFHLNLKYVKTYLTGLFPPTPKLFDTGSFLLMKVGSFFIVLKLETIVHGELRILTKVERDSQNGVS